MFGKAAINPQRYPHREPIHRPGDLRYLSSMPFRGATSHGVASYTLNGPAGTGQGMAFCDRLKGRISTAQTSQLQLADAFAEQAIGDPTTDQVIISH